MTKQSQERDKPPLRMLLSWHDRVNVGARWRVAYLASIVLLCLASRVEAQDALVFPVRGLAADEVKNEVLRAIGEGAGASGVGVQQASIAQAEPQSLEEMSADAKAANARYVIVSRAFGSGASDGNAFFDILIKTGDVSTKQAETFETHVHRTRVFSRIQEIVKLMLRPGGLGNAGVQHLVDTEADMLTALSEDGAVDPVAEEPKDEVPPIDEEKQPAEEPADSAADDETKKTIVEEKPRRKNVERPYFVGLSGGIRPLLTAARGGILGYAAARGGLALSLSTDFSVELYGKLDIIYGDLGAFGINVGGALAWRSPLDWLSIGAALELGPLFSVTGSQSIHFAMQIAPQVTARLHQDWSVSARLFEVGLISNQSWAVSLGFGVGLTRRF